MMEVLHPRAEEMETQTLRDSVPALTGSTKSSIHQASIRAHRHAVHVGRVREIADPPLKMFRPQRRPG